MKTFEKCLLFGFLSTILLNLTIFSTKCENINEKVLRLHILANSNSDEDQDLKIKVRDAILQNTSDLFANIKNKEEAKEVSQKNIDIIKEIAKSEIVSNGYNYDVNVEVINMHFNTRRYENITMPAGSYDTIRISIGKAEGHNWWCVMFPPMCLPAAEKRRQLSDVLTTSEIEITINEEEYSAQFKIIEYIDKIRWFINKIIDMLCIE